MSTADESSNATAMSDNTRRVLDQIIDHVTRGIYAGRSVDGLTRDVAAWGFPVASAGHVVAAIACNLDAPRRDILEAARLAATPAAIKSRAADDAVRIVRSVAADRQASA